jgi:hypothetical protein
MNNNQYQTTSLALASAIQLASASKLQAVEKSPDSRRAIFIFNMTPDLNDIVKRFWQRSLPLDAFSFFESIKLIKARLYETQDPVTKKENRHI